MKPTPATTPAAPIALAAFNSMPAEQAFIPLLNCCGSTKWARAMAAKRPFDSLPRLIRDAETAWFALGPTDWLEAFAHHPRIGERNLDKARFGETAQVAAREQSGMAPASQAIRDEFATLNARYEQKFGHVFLICASGKSAEFMLTQLKTRLTNDAATELQNAAKQQSMITRRRLERTFIQ